MAQRAEALGFQDLWVTNNTVDEAGCFDSLTVLTYAAALTTTIRLGVSVLVLPTYHPVHVAHQVATLDHLSDGRAILGVGLGRVDEYDAVPGAGRTTGHPVHRVHRADQGAVGRPARLVSGRDLPGAMTPPSGPGRCSGRTRRSGSGGHHPAAIRRAAAIVRRLDGRRRVEHRVAREAVPLLHAALESRP